MTFYGHHEDVMSSARKCKVALSDDDLMRKAPAIFAPVAHSSRSDKYAFVPTAPVVQKLRTLGFEPYGVSAANVRDHERNGFQKHLVRMRHHSNVAGDKGGCAELILITSHDGSCSWRMLAGWFEFLCTNGLMVGDKAAEVRVAHKGTHGEVLQAVADGARNMVEYLHRISTHRGVMQQVQLTDNEQQAFAKAALCTRYEEGKVPLEPTQILTPRRREEGHSGRNGFFTAKPDLWTTFNVVQENLVRGGLTGRDAKNNRRKQREIKGIDQNEKVNRALWTLTSEMAKLKGASNALAVV